MDRTLPLGRLRRPHRRHRVAGWAVPLLVAAVGASMLVGPTAGGAAGAAVRPFVSSWGPARALSSAAPHTAPLQPAAGDRSGQPGALRPSSAGSVEPADLIGSTNWAGQVTYGGQFSGVSARWTVPTVQPSGTDEYSSAWIGIDGFQNDSLIQTGTEQDSGPDGTNYFAWFEVLPAEAMYIGAVSPGDVMSASINESSPGTWNLSITDVTSGNTASGPLSYDGPGSSAEWISEAPQVNGSPTTLADFGTVDFSDLGVAGTGGSLDSVVMQNGQSEVLAYPTAYQASTDAFAINYGPPPVPQVTSVTPSVGGTAGGTWLTIRGSGFSTTVGVLIGGRGFVKGYLDSDSVLVVTTPAGAAGTVGVTVQTLGGTSSPSSAAQFTYSATPPVTAHGYWLVGGDGGIFSFGSAKFYGSTGNLVLQRPVVGITVSPDHAGYRLVASDGGLFAFGDSRYYGSIPGLGIAPAGTPGAARQLSAPIIGMVSSADGLGYFMVGADGGVFAFGDAKYFGSCPGIGGCSGTAVTVMPDATGRGYWLVTATGSVYAFGDAPFYGAVINPPAAVSSAVRTPDGGGYWILLTNGDVYSFGDAVWFGSPTGQIASPDSANAIDATGDGGGYWVDSAKGVVFPFGDAPFDGDMSAYRLNAPIIAAAGW